jgi:DNA-binding CsgD family transcriptional regulator
VIRFLGHTRGWLRRGRRPPRTGCHTRSVSTPARLARAWCHALLGAAASVVAASLALIPVAVTSGPRALQLATGFAATLALLLAVGLPRASRRAAIRLANTLLDAPVEPVPADARAAARAGSTRGRSAVWLALHGVLGGAVALGAGALVGAAVIALAGWAGASGFLLKRARPADLGYAIRLVAGGESVLFPDAVRSLVAARRPAKAPGDRAATAPPTSDLTAREGEVLRLVATGLSNADIAAHLVISLETVKTHVRNILTKLGAANRTQAVIAAYESGLMITGRGG